MTTFAYKIDNADESKRFLESSKIIEKYPDRIPVICEKKKDDKINKIDKSKFLVPRDLTFTQFSFIIRKKIDLDKSKALNLLIMGKDNKQFSETGEKIMSDIYEKHKDKDGFLYITYTGEITWGSN